MGMCPKSENPPFSCIFCLHGYFTYYTLICLKRCLFIADICFEGSVSQNVDE